LLAVSAAVAVAITSTVIGFAGQQGEASQSTDSFQENPTASFVPGEVIVKMAEGADPWVIVSQLGICAEAISPVHQRTGIAKRLRREIASTTEPDGVVRLFGRSFSSADTIPDQLLFEAAYARMSAQQQAAHRKFVIDLEPGLTVEIAVEVLRRDPRIEAAIPNYYAQPFEVIPSDELFPEQWALRNVGQIIGAPWNIHDSGTSDVDIDASDAWDFTTGSEDVVVAVIDSGVDYLHPELATRIWRNAEDPVGDADGDGDPDDDQNGLDDDRVGWDFVDWDADPMDVDGHGTAVAGIICATDTDDPNVTDDEQIVGVAPGARIIVLRANSLVSMLNSILYAVSQDADIISMSIGFVATGLSPELRDILGDEIRMAHEEGVFVVAAAGNEGSTVLVYPAAFEEVLAVTAIDNDGAAPSFTNYGSPVEIAAPGVTVLTTAPYDGSTGEPGLALVGGTSFAAPQVAGVAALVLSQDPNLAPDVLRAILKSTSDASPMGTPGLVDEYIGQGIVNAHAALLTTLDHELRAQIDQPAYETKVSRNAEVIVAGVGRGHWGTLEVTGHGPYEDQWWTFIQDELPVDDQYATTLPAADLNPGPHFIRLTSEDQNRDHLVSDVTKIYINAPPVFEPSLADVEVQVGTSLQLEIAAIDPDHDNELQATLVVAPFGANMTPGSAGSWTFEWTPDAGDVGAHFVTVAISDGFDTTEESMYITVPHQPPYWVVPPEDQTGSVGGTIWQTVEAIDPEGGAVEYSVYLAGDLDHNGHITALDLLIMINLINSVSGGVVFPDDPGWNPEMDLDDSGYISALDQLTVINAINSGRTQMPSGVTMDPLSGRFEWRIPSDQSEGALFTAVASDGEKIEADTFTVGLVFELPIGEVGMTTIDDVLTWVPFSRTYTEPVFFAQPLPFAGSDPSVIRVNTVTSQGAWIFVDEAPNMVPPHVKEVMSWAVFEAGSWELDDGTRLEVGTVETSATVGRFVTDQWEQVEFSSSMTGAPVVVTQVQTERDRDWVKTRQLPPTATGFKTALEEEEASSRQHGTETVGWMAMEAGDGSWSGRPYVAGNSADNVTHNWTQVPFGISVGSEPRLLAAMATRDGWDGSALRYRNLSSTGVEVKVEEEKTYDGEMYHTTEIVGFIAIGGSGSLTAIEFVP
jgi:subtilisin family serine protease